jgi:hypothetical protein
MSVVLEQLREGRPPLGVAGPLLSPVQRAQDAAFGKVVLVA